MEPMKKVGYGSRMENIEGRGGEEGEEEKKEEDEKEEANSGTCPGKNPNVESCDTLNMTRAPDEDPREPCI